MARGSVLVHLDARRPDVVVPPPFRTDPQLVLRIGERLTPPVELVLDDEAIAATLTFGGRPSRCRVPWTAVFGAIVEGEPKGVVWVDDLPSELRAAYPDLETSRNASED